jgi:hypothetical protein
MARYKVLKSVAHNFAHSFSSVMNYSGNDYAMCHLLRRVKLTGTKRLRFDLVSRQVGPVELLSAPIVKACEAYSRDFGRLVTASGAALDMVDGAELEVIVRLNREAAKAPKSLRGSVTARMKIRDDRGRMYEGRHTEAYQVGTVVDPDDGPVWRWERGPLLTKHV